MFISADSIVPDYYNPQALNRYAYVLNNPLVYTDPFGFSPVGDWFREYTPAIIGVPVGGLSDILWGTGEIFIGLASFDSSLISSGFIEIGSGTLSTFGIKEAVLDTWEPGPTGGIVPSTLKDDMANIAAQLPTDSWKNGMHSWHAGSNAAIANRTGLLMAPFQLVGGIYHETPLDWESFKAEQYHQGSINHALDSTTDIAANILGMGLGYILPRSLAVKMSIQVGNYIPGPGEPDPNFGGWGHYNGNPVDAWGQYP